MSDPVDIPTEEPVGGGAESVPDPTPPSRPDRDPADPGADEPVSPPSEDPASSEPSGDSELGGPDTVASNDELDGSVER